jgi:hypothetical protein
MSPIWWRKVVGSLSYEWVVAPTRQKEGSGREGKKDGDVVEGGAREGEDGGADKVREAEGGRCEVGEGGGGQEVE